MRAGIVLAGGGSERFGAEKLRAELEGRPLLWHALDALALVVDELVVVVGHDAPIPPLPRLGAAIRAVRDPLPAAGPLVGLLAGLRAVTRTVAIVVGGDMPLVRPAVLDLLAAAVEGTAPEPERGAHPCLARLTDGDRPRPIPCAVRARECLVPLEALITRGGRSLRALATVVPTRDLPEPAWRALDPAGHSLRDVDTPGDLEAVRALLAAPGDGAAAPTGTVDGR
jgi:molybdopterin-guanine dinucleotide biosynthesis protein A